MDPVQSGFPLSSTSAATLTFTCRARANYAVGSFSSATPVSFTDLVISFPFGRDDVKTTDALRDICVQHLLNNAGFLAWWGPATGTIESNLREALELCQTPHAYETTRQWMLLFDGQSGPVLAA